MEPGLGAFVSRSNRVRPTVLQATGLESGVLTAVLVGFALVIFLWGFERYRSTFSKEEFLVALVFSVGTLVMALFPDVFNRLGALLDIQQRPQVIALVINIVFVFLVLYLFSRMHANQRTINALVRSITVEQVPTNESASRDDEPTIYVVIPAYNEADSVRAVVESIPDSIREYAVEPLVISDGSTDDTAKRATQTGTVVEHPLNQGQGGALKTGFMIARRNGADIVVTMDADGQHPVERLGALVAPIIEDEADYVTGSRYAGVDNTDNGIGRRAGIRVFTAVINLITKAGTTDCTNGFRAIRGSKLDDLRLTEERFSAPELIIEARKNGLRMQEIPITVARRETGETKKPKLGYALGLIRTIFTTWIR